MSPTIALLSPYLGVTSGVLAFLCFLPYIRDVLMRRTRPLRSSWLIWAVVTVIAFSAQVAEGAGPSLWFSGSIATGSCVVFALSLHHGMGAYLDRADLAALLLSGLGLMLWALTSRPEIALFCAIGISSMAGLLTLRKAFRSPWTETLSKWVIGSFAALMAVMSVGEFNAVLQAQPIYLTLLHVSVTTAILWGRQRQAKLKPF
ncbi:MAG: hypothetical protein AAF638_13450 [Pseudomonadota bacterium]